MTYGKFGVRGVVVGACLSLLAGTTAFVSTAAAEFTINTGVHLQGNQFDPQSCSDADGDYVVVWTTGFGTPGGDDSLEGIKGRIFDQYGQPKTDEFLVNTDTEGSQRSPKVACQPTGEFMVVWTNNSAVAVRGQAFNSAGSKVGGEFSVSEGLGGFPDASGLCASTGGAYFVTFDPPGGLRIRRLDASGPTGPSTLISTTTGASDAFLGCDAAGNAVVQFPDFSGEKLQFISSAGALVGSPVSLDFSPLPSPQAVGLTVLPNGNSVVVVSELASPSTVEFYARKFDSTGAPVGSTFLAHGPTTNFGPINPVATSDSGFVLAFADASSSGKLIALGYVFDSAGVQIGGRMLLSPGSRYGMNSPSLGIGKDGDILLTLNPIISDKNYGKTLDLYGQVYNLLRPICTASPKPGCNVSNGSSSVSLTYMSAKPSMNKLTWKQSLAVPYSLNNVISNAALCVYDYESNFGELRSQFDVLATNLCGPKQDKQCVTLKSGKLKYSDAANRYDGVSSVTIDSGKISFTAKRENAPLPPPMLPTQYFDDEMVEVQLQNSRGECWTSEFDGPSYQMNSGSKFRAVD